MRPLVLGSLLSGLALAGCARHVPEEQLTNAKASVLAAEQLDAEKVPSAALHVQLAREQISEARMLLKEGQERRASLRLQRASADAELAVALAKEEPVRADAERALQEVKTLQSP